MEDEVKEVQRESLLLEVEAGKKVQRAMLRRDPS